MNIAEKVEVDLQRYNPNLKAIPLGNRIKILYHGKEVAYLVKTNFHEWALYFAGDARFSGSVEIGALNGIARAASRLVNAGKRKYREKYRARNYSEWNQI